MAKKTSSTLVPSEIMVQLKEKRYMPLYFLYGEEPYYIDQIADYIEQNVLDESEKAFDMQILYGRDYTDISPIVTAAKRYPMMAPYQVIILKEAQQIKKWEALTYYLEQPNEKTILVICYKYGKPNFANKPFCNLKKCACESVKLKDYQVDNWILQYIRSWNADAKHTDDQVSIDERVVPLISNALGSDLSRVATELQKLVNGRPQGCQRIDADLVQRNIGISKDYNVFELQKALIMGEVVKANQIINYFADNPKNHSIQGEISILFSFFENLMIYHYLPDKNERVVGEILHINSYFVKDYAAAARRFSAGKTFRIIGYFREADAKSKGIDNPSAGEKEIWQELIYKILH